MCDTCGCSGEEEKYTLTIPGEKEHTHSHHHHHGHDHKHNEHDHHHDHHHSKTIKLETDVLSQNNLLAERNRGYFEAKNIIAYNLVSSPGAGKTSLLERTIREMGSDLDFYVIEGDQQTANDADRIYAAGAKALQINTGSGCHLDAQMVNDAVKRLGVEDGSCLFIENVGNLVCPAMFDLGEAKRIVIISTTEGEDKPIKYPYMFESSDICIINKMDLVPYLDMDVDKIKEYALRVNHHIQFIELSVKTGEGMDQWYEVLKGIK